jgi:nitroreductase
MDFEKVVRVRRSVRKYKSKAPSWRKILEALDCVRYTPMAGNIFTPRMIVVKDPSRIAVIAKACQQDFVATAKTIVVFVSDPKMQVNCYEERGKTYTIQQGGAAIQTFLLSLVDKGLSACWVGLFDEVQIKKVLDIPENISLDAVIPIGYLMDKNPHKKKKIDLDAILKFETFKEVKMKQEKRVSF